MVGRNSHKGSRALYLDEDFLESEEGRSIRILAEYLHPLRNLQIQDVHSTIVFFGSARIKPDGPFGKYYESAKDLARRLADWSKTVDGGNQFIICTGGGPGIMEAANRGASEAEARTMGLNIGLPYEQRPNSFISPDLQFDFRYFFMRKLWFAHLARALVVFPGGFGTLDELFEVLTLLQTKKISRKIPIVLYGSSFWKQLVNFDFLVDQGFIKREDMDLFHLSDAVEDAFQYLKSKLHVEPETTVPGIAKSRIK
jgi:uncharacterized protein (TIGR00730 family)